MTSNEQATRESLSIHAIRDLVSAGKVREIWDHFDEYIEKGQLLDYLKQEYPRQAGVSTAISRRDFLKIMGASLAFAGLSGCVPRIAEQIYPYVHAPQALTPGQSLSFASTHLMNGYAQGIVVRSDEGRPNKVDGNSKHPASLGASDIFMQASILDLYDPDRAQEVKNQGAKRSWQDFTQAVSQVMASQQANGGSGLRILTGTVTSPTLNDQLQALLAAYPNAKWHSYSPINRDQEHAAAQQAFGQAVDTVYLLDRAAVILSLDADFMFRMPGHIRYSKDFEAHRQVPSPDSEMNRLYVLESSLTVTGSNADHRLPVQSEQIEAFANALASRLGINASLGNLNQAPGAEWLDALVDDLRSHSGASVVMAGDRTSPAVHQLAYAINQALGNVGQTVIYIQPVEFSSTNQLSSLSDLVKDLDSGQVELLVILDENPVYSAPSDLHMAESMKKAKMVVYQGLFEDETAALAHWFVPATHYLETWSDARAFDGTASIVQPLIESLYAGKSTHEVVAALLGQVDAKGYDIIRAYWKSQMQGGNFEQAWQTALSDGIVANTALPPQTLTPNVNGLSSASSSAPENGIEIVFEPDPSTWDGRFTNNAWLQELPKPLTKLTWDNAILVSPQMAGQMSLKDEDVVEVKAGSSSLEGPVLVVPGLPANSITVYFGYGRKQGGKVLEGVGYNAYELRTSQTLWHAEATSLRKTGTTHTLATTRDHQSMEGRNLVRTASIDQFRANQQMFHEEAPSPSLYPDREYPGHAWGMSINLSSCIGCNACVLACQAENNIPVVGKDQVVKSREMHWLRVDRYFQGAAENPQVMYQPVPCMHCETAPCEVVCPVEATSHSAEGVNEMTYNRCVGTRYCSNNCPYKVRRFNFLDYVNPAESLKAMRNPQVTIRPRGVMEKCNYCIQRIDRARIREQVDGKPIQDSDLKTACQQACPANAIVFGDLHNQNSEVHRLKELPQNYALLSELNTKPRTTYLARLRNPNPRITS